MIADKTSPGLTTRQAEVLRLIADGMTAREAADSLGLAIGTANLHLHCARQRTGCRTIVELVAMATRRGLI